MPLKYLQLIWNNLLRTARLAVGVMVAEEEPGFEAGPPDPADRRTLSIIAPFLVGVRKPKDCLDIWSKASSS